MAERPNSTGEAPLIHFALNQRPSGRAPRFRITFRGFRRGATVYPQAYPPSRVKRRRWFGRAPCFSEANEAKRRERNRKPHCYRMCRTHPVASLVRPLDEIRQLIHGQTDFAQDCSKGALGHLSMIGYRDATKRWLGVPQNDMAPLLSIHHVASPLQRSDELSA
jgi:hypothetical protein